jgi:hypothetical protein
LIKSELTKCTGGVFQYDFGKTIQGGKFIQTGSLNKPPRVLMTGVSKLGAQHQRRGNAISENINNMFESYPVMKQNFGRPSPEDDQLFQADYDHIDGEKDCKSCDQDCLVQRMSRTDVPFIHYGLIGSANQVMRHGATREKLRQERGIICFEMEAAGLMDTFPCLVIRGICDYSDTHKNKKWQPYAAATAAAYAKELLGVVPLALVDEPIAADLIKVGLSISLPTTMWC